MSLNQKRTLIVLLVLTLILIVLNLLALIDVYQVAGRLVFKDIALLISLLISSGLFVYALYRR